MKVRFEQLAQHTQQPLLPIYVICGDEPLQVGEASDQIRQAAREQGFSERQLMHAEAGFDWNALAAEADALSLFAERKIVDLRIPAGKPGDAGGKALTAWAERPPEDNLLMVTLPKMDKRQQSSKWFKALESAGAVIEIWPVKPQELPRWLGGRAQQLGLQLEREALQFIAGRVEGNLLAASQELEKLHLLHGEGAISFDAVREAVVDSARYNVFELVDTALAGDAARALRIVEGLRGEGTEAIIVSWAVTREIRSLAQMAEGMAAGASADAAMREARVWSSRQRLVTAGLKRHNARRWQALLARCLKVDKMIKGAEPGNPWDELVQLTALMAGVRLV